MPLIFSLFIMNLFYDCIKLNYDVGSFVSFEVFVFWSCVSYMHKFTRSSVKEGFTKLCNIKNKNDEKKAGERDFF